MRDKIRKDAEQVVEHLWGQTGTIYTFGNGGSASIANHMACDWMKSCWDANPLKVISLCSNMPLMTAIANDFGYEYTASKQIEWLANKKSIVVLVSSSGKSPNVIEAALKAKRLGCLLIGFTGFKGGELRLLADVSIHIESDDYGIVEDYHSQVMHEVVRLLKAPQ